MRWWRPRRPAPRAAFGWRWLWPVVLIGLIAAAGVVADAGSRAALRTKGGRISTLVTDPTQPGFIAQVTPTPTLLVVITNPRNEPLGVTAMSLLPNDAGGWLLHLPVEVRVQPGDKTLAQLWKEGTDPESSKDNLARAVGRLLDVGFPETIVLTDKAVAALARPVMPLRIELQDRVQMVALAGGVYTRFPAGAVTLSTESDVVDLIEAITPGESPQQRHKRQLAFLESWIGAIRTAPDRAAVLPNVDGSLRRFLAGLSASPATEFKLLPIMDEVAFRDIFALVADVLRTRVIALQMVPFPVADVPGGRVRVSMLNGTTDRDLTLRLVPTLVSHNAQIEAIGNALTFDVARSEIVYYDASLKAAVERMAKSIGIPVANLRLSEQEASVDATITLGADLVR